MNISKSLLIAGLLVSGIAQANSNKYCTEENRQVLNKKLEEAKEYFHTCDKNIQSPVDKTRNKIQYLKDTRNDLAQKRKMAKEVKNLQPEEYQKAKWLHRVYKQNIYKIFKSVGSLPVGF